MDIRYFVVAFLVLMALFAFGLWKWLLSRQANVAGSVQVKKFMTGNEIEFFSRLNRALPEFHVFPQVSMGALLQPDVPSNHYRYWTIRDTFAQKICDFVVCDRKSLSPLFIIELDDRMHDFDKDAVRDDIVAKGAFKTVRFWSRKKPTQDEIRKRVSRVLGPAIGFVA